MKRAIFAVTIILALSFVPSGAWAAPGDTEDNPIFIATAEGLDNVRLGLDKFYKLSNDIDLTAYLSPGGAGFAKWGAAGWLPFETFVSGGLDGNGHKITGLWIDRSSEDYIGLFMAAYNITIRNLGVEIAAAGVRGRNYVGGLIGEQSLSANIINCYTTGNISAGSYAGGLIGRQLPNTDSGNITNCYATGNISAGSYAGGLLGEAGGNNRSRITNSYATGNVSSIGSYVGGLAGSQNGGTIENCYATGDASGFTMVGGLVGMQNSISDVVSTIANCYVMGNVSGGSPSGSVVGFQTGAGTKIVTNCYRYQLSTLNGVVPVETAPNGNDDEIKTAIELMTKATYTGNGWLFNDSTPIAGPWYWDNRGFPKLNMGTEEFPFPWEPLTTTTVITINAQPAANTTVTAGSINGNLSVAASVTGGGIVSYQWYSNTTSNNVGGSPVSGATSSSFAIPTNLSAGTYYYYCMIRATDAAPVTSNVARVTVEEGRGCNAIGYGYIVITLFGATPLLLRKRY